jgi:hypothetical protein
METLGIMSVASLFTLGCADASPSSVILAPSPIIIPDAVTIGVGVAQIFSVQNATIARFELAADNQPWSECVVVDTAFAQANSIRLVARNRCQGFVYVIARIGNNRSPVVAVMSVQ